MSELDAPRHGLEPFLQTAPAAPDAGLSVRVRSDVGFVNLRGDGANPAFANAVSEVLGQTLPRSANTLSAGEHRVYWLGPDEWLAVLERDNAAGIPATLDAALAGQVGAVNDVGGGNVALWLEGAEASRVLAKGCTLDLHPDVFRVHDCAQTGLAKANVLLGRLDAGNAFEIVVRRSFADYLCRWLAHAAKHEGVRFGAG